MTMAYSYDRFVEWGDCDDFGIVFYPHFYAWFDSGFHRMCLAKGYTQRNIRQIFGARGTPLIEADALFRAPATYGDTITVHSAFSHWGRSSMTIDYWVTLKEKLIVTGIEKRVWTRPGPNDEIIPAPIPDRFRADLAEYSGTVPA